MKVRIVRDNYCGYAVQVWRWWFPFWIEPYTNTHVTVEDARRYARVCMEDIVEYVAAKP